MAIDRKYFVPVDGNLSIGENSNTVVPSVSEGSSFIVDNPDQPYYGGGVGSSTDDSVVHPDENLKPKFGDPDNPDIWSPNTDISPAENISDLYGWLYNLIQNAGVYDINIDYLAHNYLRVMRAIAQSTKNLFDSIGYDRKDNQGAIIDIIEKVTNIAQGYLDQIFTQALSYQTWYLQQEYNSPVNQLKRLEAAGLSSAFFFGSMSNSAQSPAGFAPSSGASAQMSGAGAAVEQARANDISLLDTIFGGVTGVGDMIEKGISSFRSLAEADNIRKMTPIQIASGIQDFKNLGVLNHYYRSQVAQIENDIPSKWFQNDFMSFQQDVQNAGQAVKNTQAALDNASTEAFQLYMGNEYVKTERYTQSFTTRDGKQEERDFSLDELRDAWENGGKTKSGETVFTKDDYAIEASASQKTGVSAFPFSASVQLGAKGSYGKSDGTTVDNTYENSNSESHQDNHTDSHFDAKTQTLTIGNQKFVRVEGRKMMSSPQYIEYMDKLRNQLVHDMDYFNALTTGERARAFQNFQMYLDNKAKGLKWSSLGKLRYYLNQSTNPSVEVGD